MSVEVAKWIVVACFFACSSLFVYGSGKGFDITDEGFYLIWDSVPFDYRFWPSKFGYVWHPLYEMAGGQIWLFRIEGLLCLLAAAYLFARALWGHIGVRLLPRSLALPFILAVVTTGFWNFRYWLITPNYDQLNLCGLLLFFAGVLSVREFGKFDAPAIPLAGGGVFPAAVLSAAGWTICVLAKPPTALSAMLVAVAYMAFAYRRIAVKFLAACGLFAGILLSAAAILIDGSLVQFVRRLNDGRKFLELLDGGYDVLQLVRNLTDPIIHMPSGDALYVVTLFSVALASAIAIGGRSSGNFFSRAAAAGGLPLIIAASIVFWRAGEKTPVYTIEILIILLSTMAVVLWRFGPADWLTHRNRIAAIALLTVVPIAYSFGTNTDVIYHAGAAAIFWAAALLLAAALAPAQLRVGLFSVMAVTSASASAAILFGAAAAPYRLGGPIWRQDQAVQVGPAGARLDLSSAGAAYIQGLERGAVAQGFRQGTPIIDLTGTSPGTVFALGGQAPGTPWLAGSYRGSARFASTALSAVPRIELRDAWVITAPDGRRAQPVSILRGLGLNFPEDYREVARGHYPYLNEEHILWMPRSWVKN